MRNRVLSITVLGIGALLMLSNQLATFPLLAGPASSALPELHADPFRVQQAHLRTIDPLDIDIVPTSRPIPEGIPLSSLFGMRKHPILGVDKMHKGVDFPAPLGTPVLATATGRVAKAVTLSDSSSYGKYLWLMHDEEYVTIYAHLHQLNVTLDDIVEEGDTIGFVGTTGRSTNPHLHYEVIRDGRHMDPEEYF